MASFETSNTFGAIISVSAKVSKTLYKFDPITFATAISALPFLAADNEVATSGKDVPIEIMVNPITSSDKPKIRAIITALSTIQLEPSTINAKPMSNKPPFLM